jgi:hypothetical protein
MELLCPHCLKKIAFPDDKAGQVLNCPLCQGVFRAPELAPTAYAPPAPSAPPITGAPQQQPEGPAPFSNAAISPPPPAPPPPASPPPKPAPPPGEYTRKFAFRLRPDVLVWIPPPCVLLIFLLSFFTWHTFLDMPSAATITSQIAEGKRVRPDPVSFNLWEYGFKERGSGMMGFYAVLIILALPVSVVCLILELGLIPTPPQLTALMPWKSGVTFALLFLTFFLFAYDYQQGLYETINPIGLGEKIAFRVHLIALVASGLELWVQSRLSRNLPLPRFTIKL